MNTRGNLMYGGSGASNMVAKIISSNQRCFNLNKVKHPSANLQRRYGDGSFEIDDSYWRMRPTPQRWDGGISRNSTPSSTPLSTPQSTPPSTPPSTPKSIFDTPMVEIPQPQFIQITPQLSIPVQHLHRQPLQMAINTEPIRREDFQPEAPKLREKDIVERKQKIINDTRNGTYFRPQGKLVQFGGSYNAFMNDMSKDNYDEFISKYEDLTTELDKQKTRIKKYIKLLDDEKQIKRAKGQLEELRNEYNNSKRLYDKVKNAYN